MDTHLAFYSLIRPALEQHLFFGLGLNTFSAYFEFLTGKTNFGPHSFYVALLTETGLVGAAVYAVWLGFLFSCLASLRRIGRRMAAAGNRAAARVRPLSWGLTAALAGTLAVERLLPDHGDVLLHGLRGARRGRARGLLPGCAPGGIT